MNSPSARATVAAATLALLAACGTPLPAPVWLRMPVAAPVQPVAPAPSAGAVDWHLVQPIPMPAWLDRSTLPRASADGTVLTADPVLRWAEPLRDALPRLLRRDLSTAVGRPVGAGPAAAAAPAARVIRVEIERFELDAAGQRVELAALVGVGTADRGDWRRAAVAVGADLASSAPGAIAVAHREAIARLAERIAVLATAP